MIRASFLVALATAVIAVPNSARADRVTCADGTMSESGRGACSHHGGVAKTRKSEPKTAPKKDDASTMSLIVRCQDGSVSVAIGRGACSHHGGVAEARQPRTQEPRATQTREPRTTQTREPRTQAREPRTERRDTRTKTPWWKPRDEHEAGKPMARCRDGSTSYSMQHRGTCSHHGGVADWFDD